MSPAPPARALVRVERDGIRPPKFADKFAVLDFEAAPIPVISMFEPPAPRTPRELVITVRGDDLRARPLTWQTLASLPAHDIEADLICQIFNWAERVRWRGVRLADVLEAAGIRAHEEGYYAVYSRDGHYFETLSADEAEDPRLLLATGMNGGPLPPEHGGPVRLVVPFLQGYKSVKWVEAIHAYRHDPVGIKRLLAQSKTARLGQAWVERLGVVRAAGRAGDP